MSGLRDHQDIETLVVRAFMSGLRDHQDVKALVVRALMSDLHDHQDFKALVVRAFMSGIRDHQDVNALVVRHSCQVSVLTKMSSLSLLMARRIDAALLQIDRALTHLIVRSSLLLNGATMGC